MDPLNNLTQQTIFIMSLGLLSFCIAMLITPIYTYFAFKYKLWKRHRTHASSGEELTVIKALRIKRNIPMMAGIITVIAVTVTTLLLNLERGQTWLLLAALLGGGLVGLADDIINIKGSGGKVAGLQPFQKLAMIIAVSAVCALFFYFKLGYNSVYIPGVGDFTIGWLLMPLFILAVVSTSNAVNISDGMDGLAGGLLINAFSAFGIIALFQGNFGIAGFCFSVAGALLAYLWFNIPPARFIMGDIGSFSLGLALGVVAMQTNTLILLPVIGVVFVAEAGSSLLQIMSKKVFHRKIFIAAPIHHHFEAMGWPKTKVTMRFWVISQTAAVIGVALALTTGFIK